MKKKYVFIGIGIIIIFVIVAFYRKLHVIQPYAPTPPQYSFDWVHTDGKSILDSSDRVVILRGFVTITHNSDASPVDYRLEDYQRMRSLGANYQSIRLFAGVLGGWPGKRAYNTYIQRVDRMVSLAKQAGIYTEFKMTMYDIKDFRRGTGWDKFWQNNKGEQEKLIEAWKIIWERYQDEPAVVGYDLLNEPEKVEPNISDEEFVVNYLIPFYQKAIDEFQNIDENHLAFFQPAMGHIEPITLNVDYLPFSTSVNRNNVVYAPHFYTSATVYDATNYISLMEKYKNEADLNKAPLFIGEYGMPWNRENDGNQALEDEHQTTEKAASTLFDQHMIGFSRPWYADDKARAGELLNWAIIKGTSGLAGPDRRFITDIFARPYPQKVAGILESFQHDFDNNRFRLKYTPDISKGITEIYVPRERHYVNGFTVNHSAGVALVYDSSQPSGLRIINNPQDIDADAFSWGEKRQVLTIDEWLDNKDAILDIFPSKD